MKKRWLCLFVENEIGVLAKITGLFSGKSYNLNSLTVGVSEDSSISRMTISLISDDRTFEQVKKQLNRSIEVIKVIDYTNASTHVKEIMFMKISNCTNNEIAEIFKLATVFDLKIIDCSKTKVLLESINTEDQNDVIIEKIQCYYPNCIEITRGGSVAVETIGIDRE